MSTPTSELDFQRERPDSQAIIDVAREAERRGAPTPIDPSQLYVTVDSAGAPEVLDLEIHLPRPKRKTGSVVFTTAESFAKYLLKHSASGTERGPVTLWADLRARRVTAVLDDHEGDEPGWAEHRATLALQHTPDWNLWMDSNRKMVGQETFAELIEEALPTVIEPDGAALLEIAQSFRAHKNAVFKSDRRLSSGQVQLTYQEDIEATAGRNGDMQVPATFKIGLAPFEGVEPVAVTARLRFRLNDGKLTIGYILDRPEHVLRDAFAEVVAEIEVTTSLPVWQGIPR